MIPNIIPWMQRRHGELTYHLCPNNMIHLMLRDERSWNVVVKYVEEVIQAREAEKRRSQSQN